MPAAEDDNPFNLDPDPVSPRNGDETSPKGAGDPQADPAGQEPSPPRSPKPGSADPPVSPEASRAEAGTRPPDDEEELDLSHLDDDDEDEPAPPPASRKPASDVPVGIPIEGKKSKGKEAIKSLDVCPNCGEPMRESSTLLCMKCGFDLKTMSVVKTKVGEVVEPENETVPPISGPGRGDQWLPAAIAIAATLVILIGLLAGYQGLFDQESVTMSQAPAETASEAVEAAEAVQSPDAAATAVPSVRFGTRMLAIVHFLAMTVFWIGCGLGALAALGQLTKRPFGDVKLALMRAAAIMTAMVLPTLVNLDSYAAERTLEICMQAIVALGLTALLFKLSPRDIGTAGGITIVLAIVLYWGAVLITL